MNNGYKILHKILNIQENLLWTKMTPEQKTKYRKLYRKNLETSKHKNFFMGVGAATRKHNIARKQALKDIDK